MLNLKKINRDGAKQVIALLFFSLAGSFFYSVSVNTFTAPNDILLGGFTGIAVILQHLFEAPIGLAVVVMNIPLFLISLKKLGPAFVLRTLWTTLVSSAMIDWTATFLPVYEGDKLLSALFGGVFSGLGLSLFFLQNTTSGGIDILAKLLRQRFPHLSMGRLILGLDVLILGASYFVYRSVENLLYAVVVIYVSTQAIDVILYGAGSGKLFFIITSAAGELTDRINRELHRGVSVISTRGGYTGEERKMLFCVVRRQEIGKLTRLVREADEKAFVVVSDAGSIFGEGFQRSPEEV